MKNSLPALNDVVKTLKKSGAIVIRSYRSRDELASQIQSGLNEGKTVVFIPTPRSMRAFFNVLGFIAVMTTILARLSKHSVLIEPNFYGSNLIMAVTPMDK